MAGAAPPPAPVPSPFDRSLAKEGFRHLRVGSYLGLVGQVLIWGSVIALWIAGSVFSNIPLSTTIAYGAQGISVSAGVIFAFNFALVAGALIAAYSILPWTRGLRSVAKASLDLKVETETSLAMVGAIGLALFAVGWLVWLGSFVPPGSPANGDSFDYAPVLASNISVVVYFLLALGGLLAFLGMLGVALGSSKVGTTYEEGLIELGGALALLPVLSIVGPLLSLLGLAGGIRKLDRGWTPPPPPPPPSYPIVYYPGGYPVASPGHQGSWDELAVVLIVVVVLLWLFVLPIAVLSSTTVHGPASTPGGNYSAGSSSNGPASSLLPLVILAIAATAVLVPLAVVRNRRKRKGSSTSAAAPPPPTPPPPPPPPGDDDPLDHLV